MSRPIQEIETRTQVLNDIPLILMMLVRLGVNKAVDKHVQEHGNHTRLSTGCLVVIWLTHILHTNDHTKSNVESWVNRNKDLLEKLTNKKIEDKDFEDNRIGRVLTRLSEEEVWLKIEEELWSNVIEFHELPSLLEIEQKATDALASVHIDFTASCGYHQGTDGLMRFGKTKDYRSDLPQIKLAGASFGGHILSTKVAPGNEADNPHYLPMIAQVRKIIKKRGILYAGDSKMSDKNTRLTITNQGDYYLTRLPKNKGNSKFIEACIRKGRNRALELIYRGDDLLGGGYELTREQEGVIILADGQNKKVEFTERVFVVRSINYGKGQEKTLKKNLNKAFEAIKKLTPSPGRGRRQIKDEETLDEKIKAICKKNKISRELLNIEAEKEVTITEKYEGRGRGSKNRPKNRIEKVRYQINKVEINQEVLQRTILSLGWIVYVSQVPAQYMNLTQAVLTYRNNNQLENQFSRLKNAPLSIRPIYVRNDDQLKGLINLLSIASRVMTYAETIIEHNIEKEEGETREEIKKSFPELLTSKDKPNFKRCCKIFSKENITMVDVMVNGHIIKTEIHRMKPIHWKILELLNIPMTLYSELLI